MWSDIKSLLADKTTRCLIIEDGQPRYVLLTFEAYQQLQKSENSDMVGENSQNTASSHRSFGEAGEDEINGEIQEMTDEGGDELAPSTVTLEDLPF